MTTQLTTNRTRLANFEELANDAYERGDDEMALTQIEQGASWSFDHHPGQFASATFERVLRDIGHRHAVKEARSRTTSSPLRVLHVLTEAYATGGHTRLTWRWMQLDTTREHSVVVTNQIHGPIPDPLTHAAGGRVLVLEGESRLARMTHLAVLLQDYDLIVLNIHPHDAVAVAACAACPERPRTLLVNHADHVFWIGVGATDQILDLRPSAVAITRERRSATSGISALLPLPLDEPTPDPERGLAFRGAWGIPVDAPVSMCLADSYKFTDSSGGHFIGLLRRALSRETSLHHVAVGPDDTTPLWRELAADFPGRLHLLGRTVDYPAAFDAATLFLDSFPFSSITAALEAASWGLPVLTLSRGEITPLALDDAGLEPRRARTDEEWIEVVHEWVAQPSHAQRVGGIMQLDTLAFHRPVKWTTKIDQLLRAHWSRPTTIDVPDQLEFHAMDADIEQLARTRLALFG